jgi:hypothetical protein
MRYGRCSLCAAARLEALLCGSVSTMMSPGVYALGESQRPAAFRSGRVVLPRGKDGLTLLAHFLIEGLPNPHDPPHQLMASRHVSASQKAA